MRPRRVDFRRRSIELDVARAQFRAEMLPFECELAARNADANLHVTSANLRSIERVAAPVRFVGNAGEVLPDQAACSTEALELRMARVSLGLAGEHGLREKTFTPERNEADGIEILRMNGPETHRRTLSAEKARERTEYRAPILSPARPGQGPIGESAAAANQVKKVRAETKAPEHERGDRRQEDELDRDRCRSLPQP